MTFRMNIIGPLAMGLIFIGALTGCGDASQFTSDASTNEQTHDPDNEYEHEYFDLENFVTPFACAKANQAQIAKVNEGNRLKDKLLAECARETGGSNWCSQIIRPNPASISVFRCTYSASQVHQLIHPDQRTWKHAIGAVKLIQELEQKGLRVKLIYNWWRPEPYNKNVGGAPGRHPNGTSVDVRLTSNADADRAFDELCKYRRQGRIRAIGHYGTSAIHFGVGDSAGNTWGRTCP